MKYIRLHTTDPCQNLAAEEYVHHEIRDDGCFMLWQNDKTIVIGRHQNVYSEVNIKRAEELGIKIVRRNSGGGAVYHDMGNLNFTFVTEWDHKNGAELRYFLDPIIRALATLGVNAEIQGRNDLVAEGRKISGNAQCIHAGRILHHGTLLVSSDLSVMPELLTVAEDKYESKGVKSVRSRVANISDLASGPLDVERLIRALTSELFTGGAAEEFAFTREQETAITRLATEKYGKWDWNFGSSPDYGYKNAKRFPGGRIETRIDVRDGVIEHCRIYGDFLALIDARELESAVIGCRMRRDELEAALGSFDIPRYFSFTLDELLDCMT